MPDREEEGKPLRLHIGRFHGFGQNSPNFSIVLLPSKAVPHQQIHHRLSFDIVVSVGKINEEVVVQQAQSSDLLRQPE